MEVLFPRYNCVIFALIEVYHSLTSLTSSSRSNRGILHLRLKIVDLRYPREDIIPGSVLFALLLLKCQSYPKRE